MLQEAITVNSDKVVHDVKIVTKPPLNGFYRGQDYKFYKILGDPRNITDRKIAEGIKEQEQKNKTQLAVIDNPRPTGEKFTHYLTHKGEGLSERDFTSQAKWNTAGVENYGIRLYYDVHLPPIYYSYISCLPRVKFKTVQIDINKETIRAWVDNSDDCKQLKNPDYLIWSAILKDNG